MRMDRTLSKAMQRLAQFAEWTGTTPPEHITEGEGNDRTFSTAFLVYANQHNLNLDWLWLGEVRGLVMAYHRQAETSEIVSLYHQYMAITDEAAVHPSLDDEELDRLFYDRRDVIEDRMMALPCRTPGDFAAKMIVASCRGEVFPDWDKGKIWVEARSLIGGAA